MQRNLIWPKLLYFMLYMAIYSANGMQVPYMITNWKISASTVGFIMALQGVNFIGAIFWTNMADKTGKHRMLLVIGTMLSALFLFVNGLPKMIDWKLPIHLDIAYTCVAMTLTWFFQSAMFPLLDSAMISMLSQDPSFTKDQFGMQRMFGSPAHPLATIIQGCTGLFAPPLSRYLYQGVAFTAAALFSLCVMIGVPEHTSQIPKSFAHHGHKDKDKPPHLSQATALPLAPSPIMPAAPELDMQPAKKERSPVVRLLTDPGFAFYLVFVISAGLLANTLTLYQIELTRQIFAASGKAAGKKGTYDFLWSAMSKIPAMFSEIFVFLTSRFFMRKLGVYWLLLASQMFGITRIMLYAFKTANQPDWFIYLFEILKGLNSGLIVSAGVRVASDMALPGCSNSAQGLFSGTYKGISFTLAGVVDGLLLLLLKEDIAAMFFYIGCFATFTTVCFFFKFLLIDRTISLPGMARKEPVAQHDTTSTSSFGSVASTTSLAPAAPQMKVGSDKKLGV